jgi:hypothetical protein
MRQYWLAPFLALIASSAHAQTGYENSTQPWGNTNGTISWNLTNNQNPSNTRVGNCKWQYAFRQDGTETYTLSLHNVDISYPDGKYTPPRLYERMVQTITDGSTSSARRTPSSLQFQRNGTDLAFNYVIPLYGARTTVQTYTWDGQRWQEQQPMAGQDASNVSCSVANFPYTTPSTDGVTVQNHINRFVQQIFKFDFIEIPSATLNYSYTLHAPCQRKTSEYQGQQQTMLACYTAPPQPAPSVSNQCPPGEYADPYFLQRGYLWCRMRGPRQ